MDRWAFCPARTTQSYVRNEPVSLQPTPSSVQGTVESLRLTDISLGAALSLLPVLASAGSLTGALPTRPRKTGAR